MHQTNKFAYANLIQLCFDTITLILIFYLAYFFVGQFNSMLTIAEYYWILIVYLLLWIALMESRGMYNKTTFYYLDRVLRNIIFSSVISGMAIGTILFFINANRDSRLFIVVFLFMCIFIMFAERYLAGLFFRRSANMINTPRIIVVCSAETLVTFRRYLSKTQIIYNIVGIVQLNQDEPINDVLNLGTLDNLYDILKNSVVDEVIFTLPHYHDPIDKYVALCEQMGITSRIVLNTYGNQNSHVYTSMLGPLPMVSFHTVSLNTLQKTVKRFIDIVGAAAGVVITLLFSIFVIPAIKINSPGPAIFVQKRVGLNGRVFNMYKFRTMCNDAEAKKSELAGMNEYSDGLMFKVEDDPRITRVGAFLRKTSIDELPQFFNVLKGDMSLVGTRPPTMDEYVQYNRSHRRRMSIRPGITGMWQVSGRSSIKDFDMVVALDTEYIDKWSIWMDINIIFKTVLKVVGMESSY